MLTNKDEFFVHFSDINSEDTRVVVGVDG